jgi:hypothetical protein
MNPLALGVLHTLPRSGSHQTHESALYLGSAFYLTGLPYRGYLFRVGRRTSFWIVYTVDEDAKLVRVLRFWNASGNPADFGP